MDNLQLHRRGLHVIYVVNLTTKMFTYYGDTVVIPDYINMIEYAQKKAQRAQPPIPCVTPMDITTR